MPRVSGEEAVARVRGLVILVRHIVNGDNVPDPTALMLKSDPDALQALLDEREAMARVVEAARDFKDVTILNSFQAGAAYNVSYGPQIRAEAKLTRALDALPGDSARASGEKS